MAYGGWFSKLQQAMTTAALPVQSSCATVIERKAPETPSTTCSSDLSEDWTLLEDSQDVSCYDKEELVLMGLGEVLKEMLTEGTPGTHCFQGGIPGISVYDYMERLKKHFQCSNSCFVVAFIYLQRLTKTNSKLTLDQYSIHRLVATSVMSAALQFDDTFYSLKHYAKVAGVTVQSLCGMQKTFLEALNYRLHVQPEEFEAMEAYLVEVGEKMASWQLV